MYTELQLDNQICFRLYYGFTTGYTGVHVVA